MGNIRLIVHYKNQQVTLIENFSPLLYWKSLMLPTYWNSPHLPLNEYYIQNGKSGYNYALIIYSLLINYLKYRFFL